MDAPHTAKRPHRDGARVAAAPTGFGVPRELNRRFGPEDAAFLWFDTDEAPMNIGSLGIFEGKIPFDRFYESVQSKMHLVPRYRQVVVPAPLNIGRPTWEYDPDFDLKNHVFRRQLDPPGTDDQLMDLAAQLCAGRLDRNKPLWEIHVIEGVQGDRTGIFAKVHHCLVDGVSGIGLLMVTLDVSPDPPRPSEPETYDPPPIPDRTSLFLDAMWDSLSERLDRWSGLQKGLVDLTMGGDLNGARSVARAMEIAIPYFAVPAAPAPFDGPFSGERKLVGSEVSFQEVRAIRKACGGTVNDVVLAVLGGALGRYLLEHGETIRDRDMRVLTPVNVRREDESGSLGNHIAMLLVEVPVGIADPVKRLQSIIERTGNLKRSHAADGIETIADALLRMPAPLVSAFAALGAPPNTVANIVCTNVPGPMIPLYTVGHRLLTHYPMAPPLWEMGINFAVTSYDGMLYFALTADAQAAPDVDVLNECLKQAYIELRAAAGVPTLELPRIVEPTPMPRTVAAEHGEAVAR